MAFVGRWRRRLPWLDHLIRAYVRYTDQRGDNLAGAITFFGFLSFFPLIALVSAIVGYAAQVDVEVRTYVEQTLNELLPGLAGQLHLDEIHPRSTGVIGLVVLLFTGIGWIGVLREALQDMWLRPRTDRGNFVLNKLVDVLMLAGLGIGLLASVALSSLASSATASALSSVGLDGTGASALVRLLALLVAVAFDALIFALLFSRLSGANEPLRKMVRGALFAAAGFEVLKQAGTLLVSNTTSNPVYGIFAVIVGLIVWINVVARFTLFAAAWTATAMSVPRPFRDQPAVPEDLREDLTRKVPAQEQPGEKTEPAS